MSSGLLARSVLEEMLATLKLREEKPKDVPPALPARPTLKRRRPSSKMPAKFKPEGAEAEPEPESKGKASETSVELEEFNTDLSTMEESVVLEEMNVSQSLEEKPSSNDSPERRLEEFEKLYANISDEMKHKEEENAELLQKLQKFEKQWALCHEQMKCMEDVYLQQIETLKTNLASAQMTLAAIEAAANQQAKREAQSAAQVQSKSSVSFADDQNEAKEFEKQKQVFENDARAINEAKPLDRPEQSVTSSMEELQELKVRNNVWKKEYEARLGHAKKSLMKLLKADCEKQHENWWFNRRKRTNKTTRSNKIGFCSCIKDHHDDH